MPNIRPERKRTHNGLQLCRPQYGGSARRPSHTQRESRGIPLSTCRRNSAPPT